MRWRKLGLLYAPDGRSEWARTHAMAPTPLWLSDDVIRLYVGHLDARSVGRIGYVDVRVSDPTRPLAFAERPVLDVGSPGTFDDNGVLPSCMVREGAGLRLYYSGFQRQTKIPYTIFSSVATGADAGEAFVPHPRRRCSTAPNPSCSSGPPPSCYMTRDAGGCGTSAVAAGPTTVTASCCRSTVCGTHNRMTASTGAVRAPNAWRRSVLRRSIRPAIHLAPGLPLLLVVLDPKTERIWTWLCRIR